NSCLSVPPMLLSHILKGKCFFHVSLICQRVIKVQKGQRSPSSILVSFLICWNLLPLHTSPLISCPQMLLKGKCSSLVYNLPENLGAFCWYIPPFPAEIFEIRQYVTATNSSRLGSVYSGRETLYTNGSLLLWKVTLMEHRSYTL
ncbi:hypothetical protein A6R68_07090, partial [Neotoma lepida]